eukprot:g29498.t1
MKVDKVYPRTLWEAREVIDVPFAEIFVSSIATGEVLEDWNMANVVPLFRGGNENPGNYSLVSLMSVVEVTKKIDEGRVVDMIYMDFSKVIDKVLHGRLVSKTGRWAEEWQMEFNLDKCEVLHFVLNFFEEVTKLIDEGRAVGVKYVDFSKVFDKVPHGRLMEKVKS